MARKNLFDVEAIERQARAVDDDVRWFALEGRQFGETSPIPLKVKVATGGDAWGRGWTKGMQDFARGLSPKKKKAFNVSATNPLLIDTAALEKANRKAIAESGALLMVAMVGHPLEDPNAPLPTHLQALYGGEKLPAEVREAYRLRDDGMWEIPLQAEPPAALIAAPEQVQRLMAFREFVNQVGGARRELVEDAAEDEETELGNLPGGSGGPAHGET